MKSESSFVSLADRPDPLRIPEIIIIACVLFLWCGSIFSFIRHSELLRIRHRDLSYRSSTKGPMNLNRITVVHRTSDMVIHSKPRRSSPIALTSSVYSERMNKHKNIDTMSSTHSYLSRKERHIHSNNSNHSVAQNPYHGERLLDPRMISSAVRRSLLNLHHRSIENMASIKYSMSYSTNDVSRHQHKNDQYRTTEERCVHESPV